jgi:KAP family P-loop domain
LGQAISEFFFWRNSEKGGCDFLTADPDEALAVFRLVKSVGQLQNILYVLVFDRVLAEKVVSEHFPSEGPHYLEKIVQAAFELPMPEKTELRNYLLTKLSAIVLHRSETTPVHLMNLFYSVVLPEMHTPRDASS